MTKIGRPKKDGAKKAGDLSEGLCRFSFIADQSKIAAIKNKADIEGITIKLFMDRLFEAALSKPSIKSFLKLTVTCNAFSRSKEFKSEDVDSQSLWLDVQKKRFVANKKKADKPNYIDWGKMVYSAKEISKLVK